MFRNAKLSEQDESGNNWNMKNQVDELTIGNALEEAWSELRRGEFLNAHDMAQQALEQHAESFELAHVSCLALARSGATGQADQMYRDAGLENWKNEDGISLRARIAKDMVLASANPAQSPHLARSIAAYKAGYEVDGGYYPAINIAFLHMLAEDAVSTAEWAHVAFTAATEDASYYAEATRAEALLLLKETEAAAEAIKRAADLSAANPGERSTTWKQLRLVCQHLDLDPTILSPLKPGAVLHYSGHIISAPDKPGRFPADQEIAVQGQLQKLFAQTAFSRVFGSLAAGADILVAEAALEAGIDLSVVLPFQADEFLEVSVQPSGQDWQARFQHCLKAAKEVLFVTPDAYLGDDSLFGHATQFALGLARQQADWLHADAVQVAVSDGRDGPNASAGTAYDVRLGAAAGFTQQIISVRSTAPARRAASPADPGNAPTGRIPRTMIFGDLKGFSKLNDAQMPAFVTEILGAMSSCLSRFEEELLFRNTWGDGIYLVFDSPAVAARCGFALQDAVSTAVHASKNLPDTLGLRLGIHHGPVYEIQDPVMQTRNFFGSHVSHAARTEPRTPEGEIYVTAQTAAVLALESREQFRCDYVGRIPLAKDHGKYPMYHLRRLDR
jgi:class 3 adenylate cyclase